MRGTSVGQNFVLWKIFSKTGRKWGQLYSFWTRRGTKFHLIWAEPKVTKTVPIPKPQVIYTGINEGCLIEAELV